MYDNCCTNKLREENKLLNNFIERNKSINNNLYIQKIFEGKCNKTINI